MKAAAVILGVADVANLNCVVRDLAPHPEIAFAVVCGSQLLPVRFGTRREAVGHLRDLLALRRLEAVDAASDGSSA